MAEASGQKRSMSAHPDEAKFDRFDPATKRGTDIVTLRVPVERFNGLTLEGASWNVLFSDGRYLLTASQADQQSGLAAAKSRDDADLYGAFSFLTGVGTHPIWMVDVKGGYSERTDKLPLFRNLFPLPTMRTGVFADVQINTDTNAPADRTTIDPDSIRAFWKIFGNNRIGHRFYSLAWEIQPAGGEFNRSNPSSNFIAGGKVQMITLPFGDLPIDLNPIVGFETGKNLNKPSTLFNNPVNLSKYDGIARLLAGADADYYIFRRPIKDASDPYLFSFSGSWVARVPFLPEPFTRSTLVTDSTGKTSRQNLVAVRANTRHNVTAEFNWNATKLLGFQVGYKYGSLPPLFEFVDHQITVGLVFKAKFTKFHTSPGS
jgi:hypothetical protein